MKATRESRVESCRKQPEDLGRQKSVTARDRVTSCANLAPAQEVCAPKRTDTVLYFVKTTTVTPPPMYLPYTVVHVI